MLSMIKKLGGGMDINNVVYGIDNRSDASTTRTATITSGICNPFVKVYKITGLADNDTITAVGTNKNGYFQTSILLENVCSGGGIIIISLKNWFASLVRGCADMLCMIKKPNAKGSSQFKFSYKNATSGSNQNNGGSNEFTIDISDFDSLSWSQGSIKNGTIKIVADDTTLLNVSNNNYQSASTIAANTVDISQYGSLKITGTNIVGSYSSSGNITISEITLT